jgi:hypothetical protein
METLKKIDNTIVEAAREKYMADEQALQEGGDRLLDWTA